MCETRIEISIGATLNRIAANIELICNGNLIVAMDHADSDDSVLFSSSSVKHYILNMLTEEESFEDTVRRNNYMVLLRK